jgi:pimeloyl-ACP methyl ester carboxylesterase
MWDDVQIRVSGPETAPVLIYLPGLHGDWTLVGSFKAALGNNVRFVEITYARTVTWTLGEYASRVLRELRKAGINSGWVLAESFGSQIGWELLRQAASDVSGSGFRVSGSCEAQTFKTEGAEIAEDGKVGGSEDRRRQGVEAFVPLGLVMAGGFVRYPVLPIVRMVRKINGRIPMKALKFICLGYSFYARLRHRRAPETLEGVSTFVTNRTVEEDRRAILYRYQLIVENDLCAIAKETKVPVYQIAGFFDPVVPWLPVRLWLKRHCPAYRGWKMIFRADHNVLGTAPVAAAKQVLEWMGGLTNYD